MLQTSPRSSVVPFIILSLASVFIFAFPYYTHANTTLLHEFAGGAEDGQYPEGSLVLNASSTFFGVTTEGGDAGRGAIFSMHITGAAFTLLHEFAGGAEDGQQPEGPLTLDGTTLYGVTLAGGDDNLGTVFSIQTNGTGFTILHEFSGGTGDGQYPEGSLVLNGTTLYGVTSQGGDDNLGTVFSIQTNGTGFTILHEFSGSTGDGALPDDSSLVIDGTTLYGVTYAGGDDNKGTVFSIQKNGTGFTILHEFSGGTDDGSWPTGALTLDVDGIYGVTIGGGYDLVGTIFYINTDGDGFTLLHEFAGGTGDGDTPGGAFTLDGETLYGVTRYGGDSNWGTVFSFPADTPPTYTISTSINPAGAGTVSCTQNPVPEGENSTCTATPNAGYTFSAWSGDCTGATCTLSNVTSDKSVTASFTQNSYAVTATAGANGSISPSSRNVLHGSTTTFAVTPNTGYSASATGCNGTLSGTTYTTGAITGVCAVSASFTRTSSGGGGGGSSSNINKKPTLTLTASPSSITSGQSSKLTWKSTNATKCVASNGWSGSKSLSSSKTVLPTKTTTYTLTCTGTGGAVTKNVSVNVRPANAQNNPVLPIDKKLGKWFALTYPNHESFQGTHYWYQYSAVDLNLDLPKFDTDNGKDVHAIQSGTVVKLTDTYLVIKHNAPLILENGTVIKEWYSHYGHMSNKVSKGTSVKKGDVIGKISGVGTNNNHLHFSIYRSEVSDKINAISPYWLPGDYRDRTLYADYACWIDSKCIREPAGLYESRIFLQTPKK